MNFYEVLLVSALYLHYKGTKCHGNFEEDYCWRDYKGTVPSDALKAGVDKRGRPIYIGQVLFNNKLIPGKIHDNVKEISIEFHEVHVLHENIKILCTQHPEKFEWVPTRHDQILQSNYRHIFEAGYEEGHTTYVGRAHSLGELTVGKVICHSTSCYKLTTIENGAWYAHSAFEILTYSSEAEIEHRSVTTSAVGYHTGMYGKNFSTTTSPSTIDYSSETGKEHTISVFTSTTGYDLDIYTEQFSLTVLPVTAGCNLRTQGNISVLLYSLLVVVIRRCCT